LWQIAFVVVATTFMTYLLNIFAIKHLSASTLSVFMYLQPLVAIIYATSVGADQLNLVKIVAGLFVFTGVYMVTKKKTVTTN
jgi:drug/metabolite transporter (DMT)-like permease